MRPNNNPPLEVGTFRDIHASSGIRTRVLRWLQSVERLHVTLERSATTAVSVYGLFVLFFGPAFEQCLKNQTTVDAIFECHLNAGPFEKSDMFGPFKYRMYQRK